MVIVCSVLIRLTPNPTTCSGSRFFCMEFGIRRRAVTSPAMSSREALELRQRARKRQIAPLKHVDNHGHPTPAQMLNILPVAGLGDNRISTVCSYGQASRKVDNILSMVDNIIHKVVKVNA
jgi:hypothetical protein